MDVDEDDIRRKAWDKAVHAEGTREIFAGRSRNLRRRTLIRDWLAFAVPILLGFVATTQWFDADPKLRASVIAVLGLAAVLQLLLALWYIIARWDDEMAYCIRAVRDSYDLREAWSRIGRGDVSDVALEYKIHLAQQDKIDSHDVQKNISAKERQIGLRAGLLAFQRKCVCGCEPKSRNPPLHANIKCIHCGGN